VVISKKRIPNSFQMSATTLRWKKKVKLMSESVLVHCDRVFGTRAADFINKSSLPC
jgi:hypothetical protein